MKYEYKTTYGNLYQSPHYDSREEYEEPESPPSDPRPPEGDGWEIVGFTASSKKLYWSWRRPEPKDGDDDFTDDFT